MLLVWEIADWLNPQIEKKINLGKKEEIMMRVIIHEDQFWVSAFLHTSKSHKAAAWERSRIPGV